MVSLIIAHTPTGRGRYKSGWFGQGRWRPRDRPGRKVFRRPGKILKRGEKIGLRWVSGIARLGPQREIGETEAGGEPLEMGKIFALPAATLAVGPQNQRGEGHQSDRSENEKKPRSIHDVLRPERGGR